MDFEKFTREIEAPDEIRRTLAKLPLIDLEEHKRFNPKKLILPTVALIVVGGTIAMGVDRPDKNDLMPRELIGWWNSDDARYADRGFRISGSTLTLQVPDSGHMDFEILGFRAERTDSINLYEIEYAGLDRISRYFGFQYTSGGVIRFHNQSGIEWYRGQDRSLRDSALIDSVPGTDRTSELSPELAECIKSVTAQRDNTLPVSCLSSTPSSADSSD
jgi:hypothetical protein